MENYKQKYQDALVWFETCVYPDLPHEQQMAAEAFFPELQESEDERIRKEIVSLLNDLWEEKTCLMTDRKDYEKYLAWLEKQGEQKPAEWSEEEQVRLNRIVDCLENLNVADFDIVREDVNWLKSLRPQNHCTPNKKKL